jgi:hypothetical protein
MSVSTDSHEEHRMSVDPSLSVFMAARLKGRVSVEQLAAVVGRPAAEVEPELAGGVQREWLVEKGGRYRVSPAGREHLSELVAQERAGLDVARLEDLYDEFDGFNTSLKGIVTAWQVKPGGEVNDHADADYDASVAERLVDLHARVQPWLARLGVEVPRLARYDVRFAAAVAAVSAGDLSFIARPIADSYHTVWFELHEELIVLLGRDRADEAVAGRAL